jgi:hypothetical protein
VEKKMSSVSAAIGVRRSPTPLPREHFDFVSAWIIRAGLIYGLKSIGGMMIGALHIPGWELIFHWLYWLPTRVIDVVTFGKYGLLFPADSAAAILVGLVWTLVDRWRKYDADLRELARLLCSYALGAQVLVYALTKIFATGWPAGLARPSVLSIYTQLGEGGASSAFWWWMGLAPAYVSFTAVVELAGGLLMFFRRTATFGALLNLMILLNIAVMMWGFMGYPLMQTIPASRFPFIAFLLWLDRERLSSFFVRDEQFVYSLTPHHWPRRWMRKAVLALQGIFILRTAQVDWQTMHHGATRLGAMEPQDKMPSIIDVQRPPTIRYFRTRIDGYYRVDPAHDSTGVANSSSATASLATLPGRHAVIDGCLGYLRTLEGKQNFFALVPTGETGTTYNCEKLYEEPEGAGIQLGFRVWPPPASSAPARGGRASSTPRGVYPSIPPDTLRYRMVDPYTIDVRGAIGGKPMTATLRRIRDEQYPLYNPQWWVTQ